MLVLSRIVGESMIISDQFRVTVAVIGKDFVDLNVSDKDGIRIRIVTLWDSEYSQIIDGVKGIMIKVVAEKVRLGFEIQDGVTIRRTELY